MRSIKAQYFISYAVLGSLTPYLSVYLQQTRGLSLSQVGYVLAAANLAPFVGPLVMTFLADARIASRRLMGLSYLVAAVMLGVLVGVEAFALTLISYALFQIAFEPIMPLQDGLNFAAQAHRRRQGRPPVPFHIIRVWGTFGFIVPSVIIWGVLRVSRNDHWILLTAVGFALAGAVNSLLLPSPPRVPTAEGASGARPTMPTVAALHACRQPHIAIFCVGMLLLIASTAAYYGFYPIYLEQTIGLDRQWLGLVAAVGVVVEVPFMLGFGRLVRWLGLRRLMLLGVAGLVARVVLLSLWVNPAIAIGTQVFHGLHVLAIHVVPIVYLNDHAEDHYRSSMQGFFRMAVIGTGRVVGSLMGGLIAEADVRWVFVTAAAMSLVAGALFHFAFEKGRGRVGLVPPAASDAEAP